MHFSVWSQSWTPARPNLTQAQKDAFVAGEVNGVNIPNSNGGPLRMVTPGYFGINNVKHVGKLAFTAKESSVKYMKSSYRISPIGKKGSKYPSCWGNAC